MAHKATPPARGRTIGRITQKPERDSEALEYRYKGWSYKQIAQEMKISETRAYTLVQRAMGKYASVLEEEAKHIRETQYGRLDDLLKKAHTIFDNTQDPDLKLKCLTRAESIVMSQAKLYGVDVTRIELGIKAPWEVLLADVVMVNDEIGPGEDPNVIEIEAAEPEEDDDLGD